MAIRLMETRQLEELALSKKLTIAPGSLLETLVRPYTTMQADNLDSLVAQLNNDLHHEEMMEARSTLLANTMMSRAAFFRNTVLATIEHVYGKVNTEITTAEAPVINVQAGRISPPSAFTDEILESLCSKYIDADIPVHLSTLRWNALGNAELIAGLTATYGEDAMKQIGELLGASPVPISAIYDKVFRKVKVGPTYPVYGDRPAPTYMMFGSIEAAISIFLCNAMEAGAFNDFLVGTTTDVMVAARTVAVPAAQAVKRALDTFSANSITDGVFTTFVINGTKTINLMNPIKYDILLGQGGINLVTGLALLAPGDNYTKLRGFVDSTGNFNIGDELRANALNRYTLTMDTAIAGAQINDAAHVKRLMAKTIIGCILDGDIDLPDGMTKEVAITAVRKSISQMFVVKREFLYESLRDILCNTVFADTGALEFLTLLDSLGPKQVGETSNEVATLAAIQLYGRWGINQLG